MILGKIGSTNHMTKDSKANMNNEDYKYNKNNKYINKNLSINLTRKVQKSIKIQRCKYENTKKINETFLKSKILRKSKDLNNSIHEKKNNHIINLNKIKLENEDNQKIIVKNNELLDKKYNRNHEINKISKKGNLNNYEQNLGDKYRINNHNFWYGFNYQNKNQAQCYFEKTLRNFNIDKNKKMNDENIKNINLFNSKNARTKNIQTNKFQILQSDIPKKKKEKNEAYDNLTKININKDDNILKYKNRDLNKQNKVFNYKKNKSFYNGKKNNFIINEKKDEKKPIHKFTNLEKTKNLLSFSLIKKDKGKIFSKLESKNIILLVIKGKEKINKINMSTEDKIKEIVSIIEEYNLSENDKKKLIKKLHSINGPLIYKPISMNSIKIIGENFNKKKSINFDITKIKKIISDENEQKNANDNITTNYNNDEIDYKGNGNTNDRKSKKKSSEQRQIFEEEKQKAKKEKEEPIIQKMYGFRNDSNNCYLNSSLQLLTRIKELKEEVFNFNEHYEDNDTQGRLIIEFRSLLQQIEDSKDKELTLNPGRLKRVMGNVDEKYKSNYQEDSNEFIANFISALLSETGNRDKKVKKLNIVNESEKRPYENLYKKFYQRKGDSFVLDLFYGILKVTKKCQKCDNINSIKFNVFNMLELPLNNITKKNNEDLNLDQLLTNFIEEKKYEETCNNCNSDEVYSKTAIYTLPKYLIISFGRIFDGNYYSDNIKYKKNIKIKSEFNQEYFFYNLECVIEHSGGLGGGHYTSLIPTDKNNDNWIRYSDSYCSGNSYGFESRNAIILLYKLK